MAVYLLHLQSPLSNHARHYIGYAHDVQARFEHHKNGSGARMLRVCNERGINYEIVRIWKNGDKVFERKLKNCKNSSRFCPVCKGERALKNMEGKS